MPDGIEGAADVATGALIARAVDGHASHAAAHDLPADCLNCGTPLVGSHCHACGQAAHVHRTLGAFGHDILHSVLHFEGRIWRTLPLLALRPGELTRRYVAGERTRFVSPVALFLFSVFLMFAVVANLPGWSLGDSRWLEPGVMAGTARARTKLAEEKARAETALADAQRKLAAERREATPNADRVASLEKRVTRFTEARDDLVEAKRVLLPSAKLETDTVAPTAAENWFEAKWRHARENPKLVLYKIKTSAYKYSWALIPISLPFIWLLFPLRRDVGMYDHAIFATYSLTFMSLLVIVLALLGALGVSWGLLWFAAVLIPPFHLYRQLKGGYSLSRGGAVWRTFLMINFAWFAVTLFAMLLVYLGIAD